jgi:hypothetical protein
VSVFELTTLSGYLWYSTKGCLIMSKYWEFCSSCEENLEVQLSLLAAIL